MGIEKERKLDQAKKIAKRHEMWETAKKHLPESVVAGAGLSLGLSLVFWYLRRKATKEIQPEIEEIENKTFPEIEAKTPQLGSELATLVVIQEEVAPSLEELEKEGGEIVGILKKIWRFSGALPGARRVEDLVLAASIKALQGVETLLKPEEPSKN